MTSPQSAFDLQPGAALMPWAKPGEPSWYAVYTCARHEKAVAAQLSRRALESFLPVYSAVRRWGARQAEVTLPLFPGYLFVRIPIEERLRVLEVPSVVRLVGTQGRATAIPESEIEALRNLCTAGLAQPHPYLAVGRRVRVKSGPLAGLEGIITRRKGRLRLVVSVDLILRSIAVELDAVEVEPLVRT